MLFVGEDWKSSYQIAKIWPTQGIIHWNFHLYVSMKWQLIIFWCHEKTKVYEKKTHTKESSQMANVERLSLELELQWIIHIIRTSPYWTRCLLFTLKYCLLGLCQFRYLCKWVTLLRKHLCHNVPFNQPRGYNVDTQPECIKEKSWSGMGAIGVVQFSHSAEITKLLGTENLHL